ncbi:hypothetical protein ACJMK2_000310 [Sinanodonta woodiana]|uniref:Uncharacterized protein n=1 Tax=Sinanodonta woodiana TaxID=1069815 RepID=A0ABD3XQK7_SINWO
MAFTILCLILLQFPCIETHEEDYDLYAPVNNTVRDTSEETNRFTAGYTRCRADHSCGRYGEDYSWCYTDGSWDRCCEGPCLQTGTKESPRMKCTNGNTFEYCGSSGDTAADGTQCISSHPCGTHGGTRFDYYWCYDENRNKKYCCSPFDECSTKNSRKHWCTVRILMGDNWSPCKPKE